MKKIKPYLMLEKSSSGNYELGVVFQCSENQGIINISQEGVESGDKSYWAVSIQLSKDIQVVNGPVEPVISAAITIDANVANQYKKIKCLVVPASGSGLGDPTDGETDIDFEDAG